MAEKIESYALNESLGHGLFKEPNGSIRGCVHARAGTVEVWCNDASSGVQEVSFHTARDGRLYGMYRIKRGRFTRTGLAIIAGRFARDVAAQAGRNHA